MTEGGLSLIINYLTNESNAEQLINELIWLNKGFSLSGGIDYISNEVLYTDIVRFYVDLQEPEIALLQYKIHSNV